MGAALDIEDLGTLESFQTGVSEVERDRDPRNAIGREPFFGEPEVGLDTQVSRLELAVEPLDRLLEPRSLELDPEVAEAPLEEFLGRTFLPGMEACHGHDSIPCAKPTSCKMGPRRTR
jgi:hypothetical protein